MLHLFLASKFEAEAFIEKLEPANSKATIFAGRDLKVIITGIGLVQTAASVSRYINQEKIDLSKDSLLNAGIAGAVNEVFEVGSIYDIAKTSIYCAEYIPENSQSIWTQAYPKINIQEIGLHLTTSLHPVWGGKYLPTLKVNKVDLVDMEGYAFASACKEAKLPFKILKSVSDQLNKGSQNEFYKNARIATKTLKQRIFEQYL